MEITATPIGENFGSHAEADIVEISYRNGELRVAVDNVAASGRRVVIEYVFEGPRGFRLLDEGDLRRYWAQGLLESGYRLFEITSGGWKEQELASPGMLAVSDAIGAKEWFVATTNECLNVLATQPPSSSVAVV